ncbi:MAG: pyridoxamine 5'-phosphate oxidase family protein [Candidatus Hodarchaeales archaeon]|jgi:hypothetical protein
MVKMSEEMKDIVENQPFLVVSTIKPDGIPHLIVVTNSWIFDGDEKLALARWQMVNTEENLKRDPNSTVIILATDPKKRRSVRFFGEGYFKKREELKLPEEANKFNEFLVVDVKRIQYGQWGKDTNMDFAYDETWKGRFGFKRSRVNE